MTDPRIPAKFDELRLYDTGLRDWLDISIDNKQVPVVLGTASRAFAQVRELYGDEGKRIPLPVIALTRTRIVRGAGRGFAMGEMVVNNPDTDKSIARKAVPPRPEDVIYQMQFWARTEAQVNEFVKNYLNKFIQNMSYIDITIPEWGDPDTGMRFLVETSDPADGTDREPGTGFRLKKVSTELTLKAFVFTTTFEDTQTIKGVSTFIEVEE